MVRRLSTFLLLGSAAFAQHVPEGAEPNDTPATATGLPCGAEAWGTITSPADVDCYALTLPAAGELWLTTAPGLGAEIGDTVLTLLDGTGAPLAANDDGVAIGRYSRLDVLALAAGDYFVVVERGAFAALSGGYRLDVRCTAVAAAPTLTSYGEGAENNDPRTGGTATSVFLPASCSGNLSTSGFGGDWDFWRFLAFAPGAVRVRLAATASLPSTSRADDLVLYLFDGATPPNRLAGPLHARGRDLWDQGLDVRLPGGIFQVAVRGMGGSSAGNYVLEIWSTSAATGTVAAGGCAGRTLQLGTTAVGPGAPVVLERPVLGTTYSLEGQNLGSNGFAFHLLGLGTTFVDLTPLGAPNCALEVLYLDTVFAFADAAGRARWSLPVPDSQSLLGGTLASQIAVLDLSNPLGITTSNLVTATIGE